MHTPCHQYHIVCSLQGRTSQYPAFTLNRTACAVRMALLLGLALCTLVVATPTLAQPSGDVANAQVKQTQTSSSDDVAALPKITVQGQEGELFRLIRVGR